MFKSESQRAVVVLHRSNIMCVNTTIAEIHLKQELQVAAVCGSKIVPIYIPQQLMTLYYLNTIQQCYTILMILYHLSTIHRCYTMRDDWCIW